MCRSFAFSGFYSVFSLPKRLNPLKKLISIFFLAVFLFNVGGYYIVFWMMEEQANHKLLERLDANRYSNQETVVLSLPLSLPYPLYQNGFERINGEFDYQGETYKLVKQKYENDTLFIVCIKDHEAKKISAVLADYSKLANNLPAGSKQALNFLSKLFKDYTKTESYKPACMGAIQITGLNFSEVSFNLAVQSYPVESPPPEVIS